MSAGAKDGGDAAPIPGRAIERAIAAIDAGASFKAAYEALLLELDDADLDRTMQIQRESRGTWLLLLRAPFGDRRERALVVGNALSGTSVALARHGFDVVLLDLSSRRLRFALRRNAALATGRTSGVAAGTDRRLPFADRAFGLVVLEEGLPRGCGAGFDLREVRRVCAGELALVADNRFAYKRSVGRRGRFRVADPLEWARRLAAPRASERSLRGYRRELARAGFGAPRAFALYPDAREFTFVVGLDGPRPSLAVGPKERENVPKVVGQRLGLFPIFAPSFALLAEPYGRQRVPIRARRILSELARRVGEPEPDLEHLVATRGNSALLLTRSRARGDAAAGSWCVHIGMSTAQERQLATHFETLRALSERFPDVPVPQPLFAGRVDGMFVTCERRLGGLSATQLTGDRAAAARTLSDVAEHFARLVAGPARPLSEAEFESLLGARFDLVARYAHVDTTVARLRELREEARAALVGVAFPRVVYHADLRRKHVQVREDGSVLGYLDWGSAEPVGLPYFDLLHLVIHERKESGGATPRNAWRAARERSELESSESRALDRYADALSLSESFRHAIERIYPVLVAAMAEAHWDYSRPRWLHRQFGL